MKALIALVHQGIKTLITSKYGSFSILEFDHNVGYSFLKEELESYEKRYTGNVGGEFLPSYRKGRFFK